MNLHITAPASELALKMLHYLHTGSKCHMSKIYSCSCIIIQFSLLHSIPPYAYTAVFLVIPLERNTVVPPPQF